MNRKNTSYQFSNNLRDTLQAPQWVLQGHQRMWWEFIELVDLGGFHICALYARNCAFSLKVWESYFSDKLDYATGASVFWVFVVMKAKILRLYCRLAVPSKDCTAVGLCSTIAPPKLAAGTLRYVFGLHSSRRVMIVTVLVLCEHRYFETRQRAVWTEILKSNLNIENC